MNTTFRAHIAECEQCRRAVIAFNAEARQPNPLCDVGRDMLAKILDVKITVKKTTDKCAEEREKMLALMKGIESAIDEDNPVKARELAQDLERVSFRWYMKTDTGEGA